MYFQEHEFLSPMDFQELENENMEFYMLKLLWVSQNRENNPVGKLFISYCIKSSFSERRLL